MKKLIGLILLLVFTCSKDLDRTDINSVVEYLLESIEKGDKELIKDLTYYNPKNDEIQELVYNTKSIDLNYKARNDKVKAIKYEIIDNNKRAIKSLPQETLLETFFEVDGNYQKVVFIVQKYDDKIYLDSFKQINLNGSCLEYEQGKFVPNGLLSERIFWVNNRKQVFDKFGIRIKNDTTEDIKELNFKLILYDNEGREFFNKTLVYNGKINKGDIQQIMIDELAGYYTGFDIKEDDLSFDFEVISVLPKPYNNSCELIEELKTYK